MSLLLDALKKAEQAKRENSVAAPPAPPSGKPAQAQTAAPAELGFPEISLSEPEPPVTPPAQPPRAPRSAPAAKTEPVLSLDLPPPPPPPIAPRPAAAPSAPSLAEAAGSAAQNQEAAKKILAAKLVPPKRNFKLLGSLLVAAMAAGAAAYSYWQASWQTTVALAPGGISRPTAAPSPKLPAAPTPPEPLVPQKLVEKPAIPAIPEETLPVETLANLARVAPPSLRSPRSRAQAARPSGMREREAAERPLERKETAPPAALAPIVAGAGSGAPGSGIKIRRDAGESRLDPLLASAYQAFMAGDAGKAETDYRKALQQTPNNRDALLGLAAIAANRGQSQQAAAHYLRLLQLDPKDAAAQAGLIGLKGDSDPTQSESRLKTLLGQHPDAAGFLYFALGNLYAGQARWPEAQEAYFNALRSDTGNADFAFNLAVSLDHLDQRKPALAYYRRALALVKGRSAGFDRTAGFDMDQLKKRIHEISQD